MRLLQPNITTGGRLLRGLSGLAMFTTGGVLWRELESPAVGIVLITGAAFLLFEAARGWCAARACGIQTPL